MEKMYMCRYCGKKFVANEEEREITWHERSRGYYYHMECWNKFVQQDFTDDKKDYKDLVFHLITGDLHAEYNYHQISTQFNKMLNEGKTPKGIYFTCYWYFVICGKEYKPEYGIGIVPYVYDESIQYWAEQERKKQGIMQEIARLAMLEKKAGSATGVRRSNRKKKVTEEPKL